MNSEIINNQSFAGMQIMIVDDKPANLRLLEEILKAKGYIVRCLPDGEMALKAAMMDPPDIILLDINMPGKDGYEICRTLKADKKVRDVPIIFISAMTDTFDKVKAFQAGGVDYIAKPFQFEEVQVRVENHLKLRKYQKDLEDQNTLLKDTLALLQKAQSQLVVSEKMAALGVLTAGIAHEINNPINFIKTSVLSLKRDVLDLTNMIQQLENAPELDVKSPLHAKMSQIKQSIEYDEIIAEIPELLESIEEGVQRSEQIVTSLRLYSHRDESGMESVNIHQTIDSALNILKNRYKHQIDIEKHYGTIPVIKGHPGKLVQVYTNLIANAIDAIQGHSQRGVIDIKTQVCQRDENPFVSVEVADTGPGIPQQHLHKIFDPFYTTKDVGKGTGLGLSICMSIIDEHGGTFEATSDSDHGTTFSVFLPISQEDA